MSVRGPFSDRPWPARRGRCVERHFGCRARPGRLAAEAIAPPEGLVVELLREAFGRIHWAGTETATVSHGAIDGAVRSGERAAAEILDHF